LVVLEKVSFFVKKIGLITLKDQAICYSLVFFLPFNK
jgi:hypothetical protein